MERKYLKFIAGLVLLVLSIIALILISIFFRKASITLSIIVGLFFFVWVLIIMISGRKQGKETERKNFSFKKAEKRYRVYSICLGTFIIFGGVYNLIRFIKYESFETAILTILCFSIGFFLTIGSKWIAKIRIKIMKFIINL